MANIRRHLMSVGVILHRKAELEALESRVMESAKRAVERVRDLLANSDPLVAFASMKFDQVGFHPAADRSLNLIEQINQTFTYLASARATAWLMDRYPDAQGFRLNLGTTRGSDVETMDGTIAAETFATVDPRNNRKLRADIEKVAKTRASHKYVFYICPSHPYRETATREHGVKVVSLGWN